MNSRHPLAAGARRDLPVAPRIALFLGLAGLATPALAYLDPSTGSMILSAIIGMFATVGLAVKTYWYRLKNLFRGKRDPAATSSRLSASGLSDEEPRGADSLGSRHGGE